MLNPLRTHILQRSVAIPAPVTDVFEFFSRAENLDRITPAWLNFRILTPQPILMAKGTHIDYSLRLVGIPMTWRTEITRWDPPHFFEDVQLRGPYRLWQHQHRFLSEGSGTIMQDRVEYQVPGGLVEPLVHALFVRPRLEGIFDYRELTLRQLFRD